MRFSLIIPTYQRHELLLECLQSIDAYFNPIRSPVFGTEVEVLVCDDANEASLKEILSKLYPWATYVSGPSRGPAANRNNGAFVATGDWLLFIDDDCLPQPGWLESYLAASKLSDVLEGATLPVGTRTRVDQECPVNDIGGNLWSCNFAIKRVVFQSLNGFNESFPFPAMEDVEFNLRVKKANLSRTFLSDAVVLHPWRLRKGTHFVNCYAKSVVHYVQLHPEMKEQFLLSSQIKAFLIMVRNEILLAIAIKTSAGLFRQLYLDFLSCYLTWQRVSSIHR